MSIFLKISVLMIFGLVCSLAFKHVGIDYLYLYRNDDYAWVRVLEKVYHGILALNIIDIFNTPMVYGNLFWFFYLAVASPFLALGSYEGIIITTRLTTDLFLILSVLCLIYTFSKSKGMIPSLLFVLIIFSMPEYWAFANVIYPFWMANFFLLASIYCLKQDDGKLGRSFTISYLLLALAISTKLQFITFLVLPGIYILVNANHVWQALKKCLLIGGTIVVVFVLTNPYLVHPAGAIAWYRTIVNAAKSNQTDHGSGLYVSFGEKFEVLATSFLSLQTLGFLIFVGLVAASLRPKITMKSFRFEVVCFLSGLMVSLYLLIFVNKAWPFYYLSAVILMLFLFFPCYDLLAKAFSTRLAVFLSILVIMINAFTHQDTFRQIFSRGEQISAQIGGDGYSGGNYGKQEDHVFLQKALKSIDMDENTAILASPYTPIPISQIGLKLIQIHTIYSIFRMSMIDMDEYLKESLIKDRSRFSQKDLIIIDKENPNYTGLVGLKKSQNGVFLQARELILKLKQGQFGYQSYAENKKYLILTKKEGGI